MVKIILGAPRVKHIILHYRWNDLWPCPQILKDFCIIFSLRLAIESTLPFLPVTSSTIGSVNSMFQVTSWLYCILYLLQFFQFLVLLTYDNHFQLVCAQVWTLCPQNLKSCIRHYYYFFRERIWDKAMFLWLLFCFVMCFTLEGISWHTLHYWTFKHFSESSRYLKFCRVHPHPWRGVLTRLSVHLPSLACLSYSAWYVCFIRSILQFVGFLSGQYFFVTYSERIGKITPPWNRTVSEYCYLCQLNTNCSQSSIF